jgi:hypothetical protein
LGIFSIEKINKFFFYFFFKKKSICASYKDILD